MVKKRVIPVILLREGKIVQSRRFSRFTILGNPTPAVERISSWSSDELIYLDITHRDDPAAEIVEMDDLIPEVARRCSVPLAFGGGIRSVEDARRRVRLGADKITLNTAALETPALVSQIANDLGSQCVVVSIDVGPGAGGQPEVFRSGREPTGKCPEAFAREVEALGAGEILLNSVERDGTGEGFDLELIDRVSAAVGIPVIALGGAGDWGHFADVLRDTRASAVAAANIFQHSENSVYHCKDFLFRQGFPVRKPPPLSDHSAIL